MRDELADSAALFEDFTGHKATYYEKIPVKHPKTGLTIGKVLGIMYETVRDGKHEQYLHEFKKSARPRLAVSYDGKQLLFVGGRYRFTEAGITDY